MFLLLCDKFQAVQVWHTKIRLKPRPAVSICQSWCRVSWVDLRNLLGKHLCHPPRDQHTSCHQIFQSKEEFISISCVGFFRRLYKMEAFLLWCCFLGATFHKPHCLQHSHRPLGVRVASLWSLLQWLPIQWPLPQNQWRIPGSSLVSK